MNTCTHTHTHAHTHTQTNTSKHTQTHTHVHIQKQISRTSHRHRQHTNKMTHIRIHRCRQIYMRLFSEHLRCQFGMVYWSWKIVLSVVSGVISLQLQLH